jgi:hypothetical protein
VACYVVCNVERSPAADPAPGPSPDTPHGLAGVARSKATAGNATSGTRRYERLQGSSRTVTSKSRRKYLPATMHVAERPGSSSGDGMPSESVHGQDIGDDADGPLGLSAGQQLRAVLLVRDHV